MKRYLAVLLFSLISGTAHSAAEFYTSGCRFSPFSNFGGGGEVRGGFYGDVFSSDYQYWKGTVYEAHLMNLALISCTQTIQTFIWNNYTVAEVPNGTVTTIWIAGISNIDANKYYGTPFIYVLGPSRTTLSTQIVIQRPTSTVPRPPRPVRPCATCQIQ